MATTVLNQPILPPNDGLSTESAVSR